MTTSTNPPLVRLRMAEVLLAEAEQQRTETAASVVPVGNDPRTRGDGHIPQAVVSASLQSVLDCIKHAESGDYTEHSHPWDGSGAYQMIPSTWRSWSARAGYPGYQYAYLAPPAVQDAVTIWTLTHGGAHNWSPRYGRDSCTVGLP